ncbi:MAG TPA: hypothetical protein VNE41_02935 [Chitinophagaceae bacterium]|nr:hypothetical protein [Chitinophagaceae bacterium]
MKAKSDNAKKQGKPPDSSKPGSPAPKQTGKDEDDPELEDEMITDLPAVSGKKSEERGSNSADQEDKEGDEDEPEFEDEWEKGDSEEDFDPDFQEFDLPKSKNKSGKKKKSGEEEEFDFEDEFKDLDMYTDPAFDEDDDDDF